MEQDEFDRAMKMLENIPAEELDAIINQAIDTVSEMTPEDEERLAASTRILAMDWWNRNKENLAQPDKEES